MGDFLRALDLTDAAKDSWERGWNKLGSGKGGPLVDEAIDELCTLNGGTFD